MTSHEDLGFLRRLLATLGRAFRRGILGRASHDDTKQFTENCAYWDRVIAAQFAGAPEQLTPRIRGTAGGSPEPEFEPIHGWTRRQLEDYLRRNPDYRDTYEAEFQRRYHVYLPPVAGAPAGCEQRRSGGAEPASPPGERRQKEAQPLEKVW